MFTIRGVYICPDTENIISATDQEESKQNIIFDIIEDYFGTGEDLTANEMRIEIESFLSILLSNKELSEFEYERLMNNLHKPLGRNTFSSILEGYKQPQFVENWNSFKTFSVLVNCLLTEFTN